MGKGRKNAQGYRPSSTTSLEKQVEFSDSEADSSSVMSVQPVSERIGPRLSAASLPPASPTPAPTGKKTIVKRRRKKGSSSQFGKIGSGILKYGLDVLGKILSLLKWPLAIFLTISMARYFLFRSVSRITGALGSHVRESICSLPFASTLVNTHFAGDYCRPRSVVDFTDMLALQRGVGETASLPVYRSGNLPLQLKRAELATSDLRTVLAQSELTCKHSLDEALLSFSGHARDSSRAIQKTVVRVRGMVDAQVAMNEWAVTALSRIESSSLSSLSSFGGLTGGLNGLVPFLARHETREKVTRTYIHAMDELSDYVRRVIEVNEAAYQSLDSLEEDLHLIHEITGLEKQFQQASQDEVLSTLWSFLGGNKKAKKLFKENLKVLADFEKGRLADKEVVAATSVAFTKMMLQIEYMREQIQRPGLSRDDIPIEMHIRNIELGIENLRSSKKNTKGLLGDGGDDDNDDVKGLLDC